MIKQRTSLISKLTLMMIHSNLINNFKKSWRCLKRKSKQGLNTSNILIKIYQSLNKRYQVSKIHRRHSSLFSSEKALKGRLSSSKPSTNWHLSYMMCNPCASYSKSMICLSRQGKPSLIWSLFLWATWTTWQTMFRRMSAISYSEDFGIMQGDTSRSQYWTSLFKCTNLMKRS